MSAEGTPARAYLTGRLAWPIDGPDLPGSVRWIAADALSDVLCWPAEAMPGAGNGRALWLSSTEDRARSQPGSSKLSRPTASDRIRPGPGAAGGATRGASRACDSRQPTTAARAVETMRLGKRWRFGSTFIGTGLLQPQKKGGRGWGGRFPRGREAPTPLPARSPLTGISTSTVQGRFPGPKCYLEEGVPKNLAGFLKKGEGGYAIIDDWKQWAQGIGGRAKNRTGLSGPEKGIGA